MAVKMLQAALAALLAAAAHARGTVSFSLADVGVGSAECDLATKPAFRADVPTPDSLLGFALGSKAVTPEQSDHVLRSLVSQSGGRALSRSLGFTRNGRQLNVAAVSAVPEWVSKYGLEEISRRAKELRDPETPQARVVEIIEKENQPLILWIMGNVHGYAALKVSSRKPGSFILFFAESRFFTNSSFCYFQKRAEWLRCGSACPLRVVGPRGKLKDGDCQWHLNPRLSLASLCPPSPFLTLFLFVWVHRIALPSKS
jgi:hypothetical protein